MRTVIVFSLLVAGIALLLATLAGYVVAAILLFRYLRNRK
jgi:hypothetical protein